VPAWISACGEPLFISGWISGICEILIRFIGEGNNSLGRVRQDR
jgi:hypothetical protein